ncbi:hypothetical protein [Nocardia aurantia]|uniref:Restriction endonuclease type IV Mrr domain-containing protein n=1 Tax=Nocardia aurantia TaxID=2585199 RepID=A0A7K0DKC1_9NOCA|nr:hypothetical protein [Nocardia aurantia]MQY26098.1 hypothetical protein [Nocardia aurantia]
MSTKRVSPAILPPLKEALLRSFWYRKDLRAYLSSCISDREIVAQLDWTDYKRNIIAQLIDSLAANQHKYYDDLLNMLLATAEISDPAHLKSVEDGQAKYEAALDALATLRKQVEPYLKLRDQREQAAKRQEEERARNEMKRAVAEKLEQLKLEFKEIVSQAAQKRGYSLEKFINELFALFDMDAKGSFRIVGEQIDGAFTHEGTEYLFEAKWQQERTPLSDLDVFAGKINRKLDNTLGLFLSMNGFEPTAISTHSQNRPIMILMTGADLSAIIEDRISLPQLLTRKRQHASRTGDVLIEAYALLLD